MNRRHRRFSDTCLSLSLRDLEELMAKRGLTVEHTPFWRWVQAYAPEVYRRLQGEIKRKSSTLHTWPATRTNVSSMGLAWSFD
jgi:IS6 family transposase